MNDTLRIPLMKSLLLVCQTRLIDRVRLTIVSEMTIVSEKEKTKGKRESSCNMSILAQKEALFLVEE